MYQPKFNSVLVQIDDADAKWGNGNNEEMLGKSYSKGKFISRGFIYPSNQHDLDKVYPVITNNLDDLIGKDIMWNEGVEAGTTFEDSGKLYGFIYWWDIRGVKE